MSNANKRTLVAVIGDEDTTTGFVLAGIGAVPEGINNESTHNEDHTKQVDITNGKNFYIYDENKNSVEDLLQVFDTFTNKRKDIALILINQHIANKIRPQLDAFTDPFPAVLEIPSKDHPYDPEQDSVLKKVKKLMGE
ncbi:related to V-type proton ATPase subunit F [Hanseniaspora guilliermondii]|uniref:V-type proton ATPase subunit F n=1 Tax=Hanseniaspora guilliermondii TaxID=56406 RepID=A0A1L0FJQ3_9ASCO|nr:related to V-type proton ATPase subunit F [Hanseniaspora guilliermondii]